MAAGRDCRPAADAGKKGRKSAVMVACQRGGCRSLLTWRAESWFMYICRSAGRMRGAGKVIMVGWRLVSGPSTTTPWSLW